MQRSGSVIPGEVWDARREADRLRRAAQDEAEVVVAAAQAEAEAIREEARLAGDAAGRAQAEAAFTTLLVAARADAERVRAASLTSARRLALHMAEKIVARAVELDPNDLTRIAAEALSAARARGGTVLLRVHPADLATLEAARPALAARLASGVELSLVADATVGRAGCIVETPVGRLDARLSTQLDALEGAIFGAAAREGPGHG